MKAGKKVASMPLINSLKALLKDHDVRNKIEHDAEWYEKPLWKSGIDISQYSSTSNYTEIDTTYMALDIDLTFSVRRIIRASIIKLQ